jgi:hypothetical protein
LLKASQQRTVLILDLRQQIGYEGISLLAVGCWLLAEERKIFLPSSRLTSSLFRFPSSVFPLPFSFFRFPSSVFPLPFSFFRFPSSLFLLPSSFFLLPSL